MYGKEIIFLFSVIKKMKHNTYNDAQDYASGFFFSVREKIQKRAMQEQHFVLPKSYKTSVFICNRAFFFRETRKKMPKSKI